MSSIEQDIALQRIVPVTTSIISALSSIAVVIDLSRNLSRNFTKYYCQIIGLLSLFQLIASIAISLSSVIVYNSSEDTSGARALCQWQGVFLQLGYTAAAFYSFVLFFYFKLVLGSHWKESKFDRPIRGSSHFVSIGMAVALAAIARPYALPIPALGCSFPIMPFSDNWVTTVFVVLVPFYVGISGALMLKWAYMKVIHTQQKTRSESRREFIARKSTVAMQEENGQENDLDDSDSTDYSTKIHHFVHVLDPLYRHALLQMTFYLAAFWLTWTPLMLIYTMERAAQSYAMWMLVAIFTPLGGFWNALIYFSPRFVCRSKTTYTVAIPLDDPLTTNPSSSKRKRANLSSRRPSMVEKRVVTGEAAIAIASETIGEMQPTRTFRNKTRQQPSALFTNEENPSID